VCKATGKTLREALSKKIKETSLLEKLKAVLPKKK
jgi:hypothetical protein